MTTKSINKEKKEITISMETFQRDFETHLKYAEEYIAASEWVLARESLAILLTIIVYGPADIKDRACYNSLARIVNHATDDDIECVDETGEASNIYFYGYKEKSDTEDSSK